MTRRQLLTWVWAVVVMFTAIIGVGIVLRARFPEKDSIVYGTYKDLVPVAVAILAAWLGYCFQRRSSYLQALRSVFQEAVTAVNAAVEYTRWDSDRTQEDFRKTIEQLSNAIDALRGVFMNIPVEAYPLGLYPYESIKDIRRIIGWLGYGDHWRENKDKAHECIAKEWSVMHSALLQEFDRAVPIFAVSKYLTRKASLADKLIDGTLRTEIDFREADAERDTLLLAMQNRK